MVNAKLMLGQNVIDKLYFESVNSTFKSILVIFDMAGGFSGAKYKIKKSFNKDVKIKIVNLKDNKFAKSSDVDKCLGLVNTEGVDTVICVGSEIALNVGKAVKCFAVAGQKAFAYLQDNGESEQVDIDSKKNLNLIYIACMEGNHQFALTGAFEIMDNTQNTLYAMRRNAAVPDMVMIDNKMLDKFGGIARLGMELGILIMSLISISSIKNADKKFNSFAAIRIVGQAEQVGLSDLVSAEMYAGLDFSNIVGNVLHEFILRAVRLTGAKYHIMLTLIMQKNIKDLVFSLTDEDIALIGNIYGIQNCENWREKLCKVIHEKLECYFIEKDIPKLINEVGLNSTQIEQIAAELIKDTDNAGLNNLSKIKDIVYNCYE